VIQCYAVNLHLFFTGFSLTDVLNPTNDFIAILDRTYAVRRAGRKNDPGRWKSVIPPDIDIVSVFRTSCTGSFRRVLSTGTPHGIGPIEDGDEIVCRIENIGELKIP